MNALIEGTTDPPVPDEDRRQRFTELYEQHYADVLAYARRRVAESDARDVAAETFLVAWRRLDEAAARGLPWLYRTALLTVRNWERGQRRLARVHARLAALPADSDAPDPASTLAGVQQVVDLLRSLTEVDRELLLLVSWEQVDVRTAAGVVGCSPAAAAVRLHRARRRLLRALRPESGAVGQLGVGARTNPEVTS